MTIPRLEDLEAVEGARVLVRLDLNVPVAGGEVEDDLRIRAALPTLRWLLERVKVVAACSHLGKANGTPDPVYSLEPVAAALEKLLGRPVRFMPDCLGDDVRAAVAGARDGLLLLENLRFYPGEKANDPAFAGKLAAPFSHYVNDAFGTAHRAHASVVAVPALFPRGKRAAGRLMEAEVAALRRVVERPEQPFVAVVGGAKISTKTAPLEALLAKVATLAIGGGMANTFFLARGLEVGRSLVEPAMAATARDVMARASARGVNLLLPSDVVVADDLDDPSRVEVAAPDAVPADMMIVDLGPTSRARYAETVRGARTVFWNGPMGVFEKERFAAGTMAVARAMAACDGFTVVGGGESVMAVHQAGVASQLSHVSTGGGASLQLVAGKPLPAVDALEVN
jgi:phosphoglycerate kinase